MEIRGDDEIPSALFIGIPQFEDHAVRDIDRKLFVLHQHGKDFFWALVFADIGFVLRGDDGISHVGITLRAGLKIQYLEFLRIVGNMSGRKNSQADVAGITVVDLPGCGIDGDPTGLTHVDLVPAMLAEAAFVAGNIHAAPDHPGGDSDCAAEGCIKPGVGPAFSIAEVKGISGGAAAGDGIADLFSHPFGQTFGGIPGIARLLR